MTKPLSATYWRIRSSDDASIGLKIRAIPELSFLYDHSAAVLCASFAEGFGLPIVEAARRGRPVICSDIAVFREVGGDGAAYFRANDPEALTGCLRGFLAGDIKTDPRKVLQTTWADAAHRIVSILAQDQWSRRLP